MIGTDNRFQYRLGEFCVAAQLALPVALPVGIYRHGVDMALRHNF